MAKTPAARPGKNTKTVRKVSFATPADIARAAIAVDTASLTLVAGDDGELTLSVLEVKRAEGGWGLPTTFLVEGEPIVDAVLRSLRDSAGVQGVDPRQLQVADAADRDGSGWVLSAAHVDAGPLDRLDGRLPTTRLVAAASPGRLPHGQADVVALAVEDLQGRYLYAPDPDGFLPESFSLRELRQVHEAVAGYELQRDTFRRAMEPLLASTGEVVVGGRGRPAELFSRA